MCALIPYLFARTNDFLCTLKLKSIMIMSADGHVNKVNTKLQNDQLTKVSHFESRCRNRR